jgi:hypothetical protein
MSADEAKGGWVTLGQSIYERALGAEFQRLHPQMQRRFGLSAEGGVASIGTGVMEDPPLPTHLRPDTPYGA